MLSFLFRRRKATYPSEWGANKEIPPIKWKDQPELNCNFFGKLLFIWIQPLFDRAAFLRRFDKGLEQ